MPSSWQSNVLGVAHRDGTGTAAALAEVRGIVVVVDPGTVFEHSPAMGDDGRN